MGWRLSQYQSWFSVSEQADNKAVQKQTAVTAYRSSNQLLLSGFTLAMTVAQRHMAVTGYFSCELLQLFYVARAMCRIQDHIDPDRSPSRHTPVSECVCVLRPHCQLGRQIAAPCHQTRGLNLTRSDPPPPPASEKEDRGAERHLYMGVSEPHPLMKICSPKSVRL